MTPSPRVPPSYFRAPSSLIALPSPCRVPRGLYACGCHMPCCLFCWGRVAWVWVHCRGSAPHCRPPRSVVAGCWASSWPHAHLQGEVVGNTWMHEKGHECVFSGCPCRRPHLGSGVCTRPTLSLTTTVDRRRMGLAEVSGLRKAGANPCCICHVNKPKGVPD